MKDPCVIALVPTYGRAPRLARLLASMAGSRLPVRCAFVTDNGGEAETARAARAAPVKVDFSVMTRPRGPGAAQADGWRRAQAQPDWTHALLIDDDAELLPATLDHLLAGLERAGAALAVPLLTDAQGQIGWYPGVDDRRVWRSLREPGRTPADLRAVVGAGPFAFRWAPWGCVLATRAALTAAGAPSAEFGFEVEDIDYVLRLLEQGTGVLVADAEVRHVPGEGGERDCVRQHLRRCLAVQNISYLAARRRHGRAIRRYVPGHVWRLLRGAGGRPAAWRDAVVALWLGGVRGWPGGHPRGGRFLRALFAGRDEAR